jgi:hypothetical protein
LFESPPPEYMRMNRLRTFFPLRFAVLAALLAHPVHHTYGQESMPIKLKPMPPQSGYEAPAAKAARSIMESRAAAPKRYLTACEISNFEESGNYAETVALWRRMAAASPFAKMIKIGVTPQGRDMFILAVSKDKAFTPQAAAKTQKPVVLIQNGIHPGEISGKDATSMLLRDILVTKRRAALLDAVVILAMPVFNIDGHENMSPWNRVNQNGPRETGFRATAQRLNLNRDYVKADAPEMRSWLKMFTEWLPDFLIDNHVTDGADHQYDVTIDVPTEQNVWPTVGEWAKKAFIPRLYAGMEKDGHIMGPYTEPRDPNDYSKGMDVGVLEPRYSTTYAGIQNRPALLVETHSLKSHRTQVWAHYDIMVHALETIGAQGAELRRAVREADAAVAALGAEYDSKRTLFLTGEISDQGAPYAYKGVVSQMAPSVATGAPVRVYGTDPIDIPTKLFSRLKTVAAPSVPCGYLIPPEWSSVVAVLEAHGVKLTRLKKPLEVECEVYRFSDVKWATRPFEGRFVATAFKTMRTKERKTFPAGTLHASMNQRAARVAFNFLEPDGPDSAVRWGFFSAVFEQKEYVSDYVFEPIAQELLKLNPKIKAEFEERLAADPEFAANPRERLLFLYRRTPYYEPDKDRYPVARVLVPLELNAK